MLGRGWRYGKNLLLMVDFSVVYVFFMYLYLGIQETDADDMSNDTRDKATDSGDIGDN